MIKLKGGTASAMSAENPVLADRQPGFARTDNGGILKIGDGVTPWNDLPGVTADLSSKQDYFADVTTASDTYTLSVDKSKLQLNVDDFSILSERGGFIDISNTSGTVQISALSLSLSNTSETAGFPEPTSSSSAATKNYVDNNFVRYYTEINPELRHPVSSGSVSDHTFSWNIPATTSGVTHRPIVQVYDAASTNEELVLTDVMINSNYDVTITIIEETTVITEGSYRAVIIG